MSALTAEAKSGSEVWSDAMSEGDTGELRGLAVKVLKSSGRVVIEGKRKA